MAFGGPASQGHVVPSVALSVFEHRRGEREHGVLCLPFCGCGTTYSYCRERRDRCVPWGWALTSHDLDLQLSGKLASVARSLTAHVVTSLGRPWNKVDLAAECRWYSHCK